MKEVNCRHSLKLLSKSKFGYVSSCSHCGDIQFGIGNVISFMPEVDFLKLYHSIQRLNDKVTSSTVITPNGEKVILRTPVDNILLSLSLTEFKDLLELFDQAVVKLELLFTLEKLESQN